MNLKLKDFTHVDFVVAVGALSWAIAAQYEHPFGLALANLIDYKAAFAGTGIAFVRWLNDVRKDKRRG